MKKAYILIEPPSRIVSTHFNIDDQEYTKLLATASKKKCLIYIANTSKQGDKVLVDQPFELITSTIPNIISKSTTAKTGELVELLDQTSDLICPYCNKKMSSTSGLTNHIKAKHADSKV